jgi:hypothetical protein
MPTGLEVEELNRIYAPLWHITRWQSGLLCASREPGRAYRVIDDNAADLAVSLRRIAERGSLIR